MDKVQPRELPPPISDERLEAWKVQYQYRAGIVLDHILLDQFGAILARLEAGEKARDAAREDARRAREALGGFIASLGPRGYCGDHWVYTVQVSESEIEKARAVLSSLAPEATCGECERLRGALGRVIGVNEEFNDSLGNSADDVLDHLRRCHSIAEDALMATPAPPTPPARETGDAERKWHELKCWPAWFAMVRDGTKPFEVRLNDRDFAIGDGLRLREWDPATKTYSGREAFVVVTYILYAGEHDGVAKGHVVMAVRSADASVTK